MRVVSFYTPTYEPEAANLRGDLERLGMGYTLKAIPSLGSWRLNCGHKAAFIAQQLDAGEAVLWLDADARIRLPMTAPDECDFAAWFIPSRVMQHADQIARGANGIAAGTMYFAATDATREFVRRWVEVEHGQGKYEQVVLTRLWYENRPEALRTLAMHQGWCKVFDAPWFDGEHPVIVEHMQASRRLRAGS